MTSTEFKKRCEAAFRKTNPDTSTAIEWLFISPPVPYAIGTGTFRSGSFKVTADGYHARRMMCSVDLQTKATVVR